MKGRAGLASKRRCGVGPFPVTILCSEHQVPISFSWWKIKELAYKYLSVLMSSQPPRILISLCPILRMTSYRKQENVEYWLWSLSRGPLWPVKHFCPESLDYRSRDDAHGARGAYFGVRLPRSISMLSVAAGSAACCSWPLVKSAGMLCDGQQDSRPCCQALQSHRMQLRDHTRVPKLVTAVKSNKDFCLNWKRSVERI